MTSKVNRPGRLKSAVLNWLGFRWTDAEQWITLHGRSTAAGERVNADAAMKLSPVFSCVRLISQTIATLPLGLYERTPDGRRPAAEHPLARLISRRPNAEMTAVVFWEAVVASILLQRGAFIEKKLIAGRLVALDFIHPMRISPLPEGGWRVVGVDGRPRELPTEQVVYIPAFTTDGRRGVSVIEYGVEVMGAALAANRAAASTFKNGLLPTTYFKMDRVLQKTQREEFRDNLEKITGALNAGKTPLLEGGMTVGSIGINPNDAQLLESRNLSAEEICSLFGVPPTMIGRGDKASSWASSSEQLNLWFLKYGLSAWIKRIEQAIWADMLTPTEQARYYAEFTVEGLLRADTQARSQFYASALQNGWMSRNEVRRLENLPPVPGGDIYTAQSNLLPLEQLGGGIESNAVRAALMHWLQEPEAA